uniref:RNase H type-1 domain-containing protein n=1 Tax=Quercus lobata TaxID=97700 RepID=A0A7N2R4H0_QUELO
MSHVLEVNMLSGDYSTARHLLPLVDDCRALLNRIPHHQVKHCYREANSVADALASCGAKMENDFVVFDSPPAFVLSFLAQDSANSCVLKTLPWQCSYFGFLV